jgi:hypothetical protein
VQYDEIAALTVFLFHLGLHPLFLKTGKWRLAIFKRKRGLISI